MGDDADSKKKVLVAGVASIILVAAVVAVAYNGGYGHITATSKAVAAICTPTRYKETCHDTLANANTTNPNKLIAMAINATIKSVSDVLETSPALKQASNDPSIRAAYDVCEEALGRAVDDLKTSFEKIGSFDAAKAKENIMNLRVWLAAACNYQETCIDAFENTTGNAGERMKKLLKRAKELSSNALTMVSNLSSFVGSLQLQNRKIDVGAAEDHRAFGNRRLLQAKTLLLQPTIVVAQDGSGQFKTIAEAVNTLPAKNNETYIVIHIKQGVYEETVQIPKKCNKVAFFGDGPTKTIITGNKSFAGGVKTYHTATVAVNSMDFIAKDIAFQNTAGAEGHQAVALRVSNDRAVFFNVIIDGYQDTLYAHGYKQFYRNCTISGTIDFIFGDALAIFQDCTFVVRKPGPNQGCMVTAQGRFEPDSPGATVIQNGIFTAERALLEELPPVKVYLGRPWKDLSRTIIMQSYLDAFIDPTGWSPWAGDYAVNTCYYAEYQNRGPGANTDNRVKWKGIQNINQETAQTWTGGVAFAGDQWVVDSGVPYIPTMM
ncbi:hypothetical protein C2S51_004442 [Perilla frutescens var. frutescens]|nr:hypothetical protein C2S51_004442 [Perilla frutescens var. frutescens]